MIITKTFAVNGMGCDRCRVRVEQALTALQGVAEAAADLKRKCVCVTYDDSQVSIAELKSAVEKAGYTVGENL